MTKHVKLVAIGDQVGIVIPQDVLARLQLGAGDSVALDRLSDVLNSEGSEHDRQMAVAREVMTRRRGALRELAK